MIGNLLKELCASLWRFFGYQTGRLTGSNIPPMVPTVAPATPATEATLAEVIASIPGETELSEAYRRPVRLTTSRRDLDATAASNPLYQIWANQKPRAHKWAHYFDVYHEVFGSRRHRPLRILEIGIYQGASLRLWREYFDDPQTHIVGIDIAANCSRFDAPHENVHVRIGSQTDATFLQAVTRDFGPFDIIIDDGSHHCSHMIASFNHLFADALKDDGIYLAEDLHANYWDPYKDAPISFLDLCKQLMEQMHAHYRVGTLVEWLDESNALMDVLALEIPLITTLIKEIRVFDSIAVIYKTRQRHITRLLNPTAE